MQGHPIAQTKKNCIDIQVKCHSAEIEVGFHTQSFAHSAGARQHWMTWIIL